VVSFCAPNAEFIHESEFELRFVITLLGAYT
jgi:hypothetical protein